MHINWAQPKRDDRHLSGGEINTNHAVRTVVWIPAIIQPISSVMDERPDCVDHARRRVSVTIWASTQEAVCLAQPRVCLRILRCNHWAVHRLWRGGGDKEVSANLLVRKTLSPGPVENHDALAGQVEQATFRHLNGVGRDAPKICSSANLDKLGSLCPLNAVDSIGAEHNQGLCKRRNGYRLVLEQEVEIVRPCVVLIGWRPPDLMAINAKQHPAVERWHLKPQRRDIEQNVNPILRVGRRQYLPKTARRRVVLIGHFPRVQFLYKLELAGITDSIQLAIPDVAVVRNPRGLRAHNRTRPCLSGVNVNNVGVVGYRRCLPIQLTYRLAIDIFAVLKR